MISLLAQLSPGRITGVELLAITVAVTIAAIAVSARIMLKDRRVRNNIRRAQLAARINAFELTTFEVGKVAGYEWRGPTSSREIDQFERRELAKAAAKAKTDLIDWIQETFKIDRGSS